MATTYETMSKDEANSFLFGGQPQQQMAPPQAAPVETTPRKTKPIAPPAMGKPMVGDLNPQGLVGQVTQANKAVQAQTPAPQAPSVVGALIDQLTNNWQLPALGLAALAAAGYGGYKAGKGGEGLKSRDITQRIEPTMDGADLSKPTPTAVPVPKEEPQTKFAKDFEIKYGVPLATAEEISGGKITKQWEADIVGNAIKNQLPITVKKEAPVIATTATTQPATMAAPVAPTAEAPVETAKPVVPAETSAPKGPKKEPVVASFKTAKDIPEGFVFRPDVGNLDRSMYNILGPEHRQYAKELLTGGKMFGNVKDVNAEVSKLSTEYFKKLQSEIPESILSRDERRAQGIPSKFGNYGLQGFGKAAKVGGVAGTLFAVADLANAQTPEQKLAAGEALLPIMATPTEAGAPGVSSSQIENAYKLGSPYAQTEEAKKARLRERAGAGRGIAPPSAYMR